MKNRADAIIVLDSSHSTRNLKMIEAWQNSSLVVAVFPDCFYSSMSIKIGNPSNNKYSVAAKGTYHPVMGYWHFYVPRARLLFSGESMYELDAVDVEKNARHVCGDGVIRIRGSALQNDDTEGVDSDGSDAYINKDGSWYLISVGEDEYGSPTFGLKDVKTESVPLDVSGESYAYNKLTGLYHRIGVEIDEYDNPMIVVDSIGIEDVGNSFAYNSSTGLYYRIETDKDEAGALMLQIGEMK